MNYSWEPEIQLVNMLFFCTQKLIHRLIIVSYQYAEDVSVHKDSWIKKNLLSVLYFEKVVTCQNTQTDLFQVKRRADEKLLSHYAVWI